MIITRSITSITSNIARVTPTVDVITQTVVDITYSSSGITRITYDITYNIYSVTTTNAGITSAIDGITHFVTNITKYVIFVRGFARFTFQTGENKMLIFNPRRMFALRGIERPNYLLRRNGFAPMPASRLLAGAADGSVKIKHIETLCKLLNCTPNDLFEYRQGRDEVIADNHPLKTLAPRDVPPSIVELIKDIPTEKLADLHSKIDELRKP